MTYFNLLRIDINVENCLNVSMCGNCPNTKFCLVCIFLNSDWIQEDTDQKNSVFGHFSRCPSRHTTSSQRQYTSYDIVRYRTDIETTPYVYGGVWVTINQKQPPEVFCKIGVLKNFANFTEKHLCWCLFLIKLQALKQVALWDKEG